MGDSLRRKRRISHWSSSNGETKTSTIDTLGVSESFDGCGLQIELDWNWVVDKDGTGTMKVGNINGPSLLFMKPYNNKYW